MGLLFNRKPKEKKAPTCHHLEPQGATTETANGHVKERPTGLETVASTDAKGRCTICRQEQIVARRYRWKLIIGIFFPFALSPRCDDHRLCLAMDCPRLWGNLPNDMDHLSIQFVLSCFHPILESNV